MKPTSHEASPFGESRSTSFRFSLISLLLAMFILAVMSSSLLWASRLPMIASEINAWMGTIPSSNADGSDRRTQLIFLIFCYSSPLFLAAGLNIVMRIANYFARIARLRSEADDAAWRMES